MNNFWMPGSEQLHESTEAHGGAGSSNPLVTLDPGLFIWTIVTFLVLFLSYLFYYLTKEFLMIYAFFLLF